MSEKIEYKYFVATGCNASDLTNQINYRARQGWEPCSDITSKPESKYFDGSSFSVILRKDKNSI